VTAPRHPAARVALARSSAALVVLARSSAALVALALSSAALAGCGGGQGDAAPAPAPSSSVVPEVPARVRCEPVVEAGVWAMQGSCPSRVSQASTKGPAGPTLRWSVAAAKTLAGAPVIDRDGTVYVSSLDNDIVAFDARGTPRWSLPLGSVTGSGLALSATGQVLLGVSSGPFVAVDPPGTKAWSAFDFSLEYSSPLVAPDGRIFIGGAALFALDASGQITGSYKGTGGPIALAGSTLFAAGALDGKGAVHAIDAATMVRRWAMPIDSGQVKSLAVGAEGRVHAGGGLGGKSSAVYTFSDSGERLWTYETPAPPRIIGVASDGAVYVGLPGYLLAIEPEGVSGQGLVRWAHQARTNLIDGVAIDRDGVIYLGAGDETGGEIQAVGKDGQLRWSYPVATPVVGVALGDGMLAAALDHGTLLVLGP
jgi:outer membrane protein assembly factor BamB